MVSENLMPSRDVQTHHVYPSHGSLYMGHYPERILADKIFRNRANLDYCKEKGIRLNGPKLGRSPKDKALYREQLHLERDESGERNEIEGGIGICKTRYTLDCIWEKLQHTSEVTIHVGVLTRNLFKRLKTFLRLFFDALGSAVLGILSAFFTVNEFIFRFISTAGVA